MNPHIVVLADVLLDVLVRQHLEQATGAGDDAPPNPRTPEMATPLAEGRKQ